ncbi:PadR family transcriptional regulator [Hoeflea prorocentri]|uniref:PadR family transcriptional regulator n=1 Tax=Hoeflea prorocentri TaxID=1922333 RepID=A0A9X3UH04_9HYPH|nr:PadR family transcriptional regulator [Hoeflea prorocentri]MCY6381228.1 PadR family transcriptional regulator [Hoeflea prorocentri]MDA5399028.1 PadR family transcriptional regulator [Hoeflea prorocentri]
MTNAEYAVLGLLLERPSHGYDLDRIIDERGMREWTELAFSSIYFILSKLEKRGLAESRPDPAKKTRKIYHPTTEAVPVFQQATVRALAEPHNLYPSVLLGLANWPGIEQDKALAALERRHDALTEIASRVGSKRQAAAHLPAHVEALFDYSTTQLNAEREWLERTIKLLGGDNGKD